MKVEKYSEMSGTKYSEMSETMCDNGTGGNGGMRDFRETVKVWHQIACL